MSLWDTHTRSKLIPDLRHGVAVGSARFNQSERRILTSTWVAEPGSQRPASVHLWDVETQLELIPAIPNLNHSALSADFGPDDQSLIVQTHQWDSPEKITFVTYTHDLSPDPTLNPKDPQIDIMIGQARTCLAWAS